MRLSAIFLCLINFFIFVICLGDESKTDRCQSKQNCGSCIQTSLECSWCSSEDFMADRCDTKENLERKNCKSIVDEPTKFVFRKNLSLSNIPNEIDQYVNQIQPQEIYIKLRKGKSEKFKIKYKQLVDYPVDLYYLMDLSYTMRDDKVTLGNLGDVLASQMKSITKDFKLGFGSFVDKTMAPYVDTAPHKLKMPCANCSAPYSFRNHMSLSDNTELFAEEVKKSHISGNLDGPEGTLDAIVQAIVCQEAIGWREKSRKLLVVTTDAPYHQAGDGRLAGIYKPNDLKCHLDDHGYYNKSNYQDYPSINQIFQIVKKHKVNIIFAVSDQLNSKDKIGIYRELSKLIEGSVAAPLKNDSSNIVEIIKEEYRKITSSIVFKDNSTSNLKLNYKSACLDREIKETQICKGLRVGAEVEFEIELELVDCPLMNENETKTEIIQIRPVGLQDGLILEVELACNCDCEKEINYIRNARSCNGKGSLICGLCKCDSPEIYYGKSCECKVDESFESTNNSGDNRLNRGCYKNVNDTKVCSGNGQCSCNQCISCDHPYKGKHCECDPFSCDRFNNQICNGHGECNCGKCDCDSKYTGDACQCLKSSEACIDPLNNKLCGGRGECVCGRCQCSEDQDNKLLYSGKYCQKCSNCIDHFCSQFNEEVNYQINEKIKEVKTDNYTSSLVDNFDFLKNLVEDQMNENSNENNSDYQLENQLETCEFLGNNSCAYTYKYKETKDGLYVLYVLRHGKCQAKLDIKTTATSIVIATLISGIIAMIIYKIFTFWYDKREFKRFENQIKNLHWEQKDNNPLYRPSTSQFRNPAFRNQRKSRLRSLMFMN